MLDFLTVAEAKAWIGITDTTRDEIISSLVAAVCDAILRELGRDPRRRRYSEIVDGTGSDALPTKQYPISVVESVTLNAWQPGGGTAYPANSVTFNDYAVKLRGARFPYGTKNITIVYVAGLDETPASLRLAAKFTAKAFWDARLTDMNSTGENWAEVGGAGFWPSGPGSIPPQAMTHIARFKSTVSV